MTKLKYKKKICIFTTSRADYGLLKNFILKIENSKYLKNYLVVTGSHLSKNKGNTIKEIIEDKVKIYKTIDINIKSDKPVEISKSMSVGLHKFTKSLLILKPDIIVVLGDRIELVPICYSAMLLNIPIAHFNGGESTEGLMDEAVRHSVTKLSHIHFVANEIYRKRLLKMGENPKKVFSIGGTSIDNAKSIKLIDKKNLEKKINFNFRKKNFLVTYHPVTLDINKSKKEINHLLNVLNLYKDYGIIFTGNNIDPHGSFINDQIVKFVKKNRNSIQIESLGHKVYLSSLNTCDVLIGNSSSGILEAPYFKKPVVNIGERQKGRLKSINIISCGSSFKDINLSIKKSLSPKFNLKLKKFKNYYGNGNASKKAIKILERINFSKLLKKKFYE
ncbi:UDP-N-acetylglucosamine 2-epimerase (hydrolyzing) [Pelagibacterales bacterium SAG-MED08]|nr:UDP-N-acetylglucosamine 2-epimerase (hydrolyzing) [Pelagibacterales bacterium SAG-MED08]